VLCNAEYLGVGASISPELKGKILENSKTDLWADEDKGEHESLKKIPQQL
jgi:hypothetical protein